MMGLGRWAAIGEIVLAAILAFFVAPTLGSALVAAFESLWPDAALRSSLWDELVVPLAAQQAALMLIGWLGWRRLRRRESGGSPAAAKGIGWGFLLFAVNGIAASVSIAVASAIVGYDRVIRLLQQEANPLETLFAPGSPLLLIAVGLVLVSITAPLAEELFFRGFVYGSLRDRFGGRTALWGSALLFAAPHLYVVQFASIFLIGVLLAVAYARHGRLVVPIVAHAVMNGLVAVTALLA